MSNDTYWVRCEVCERDVEYLIETGEAMDDQKCTNYMCPVLSSSQAREDEDPQELDFNTTPYDPWDTEPEVIPDFDDEGC